MALRWASLPFGLLVSFFILQFSHNFHEIKQMGMILLCIRTILTRDDICIQEKQMYTESSSNI